MLIGYVRVSTNDQNTDLQRNALNCAGCDRIFEDKIRVSILHRFRMP
ncbi:DNA-invertase [Escherichia coli]|nr:DNA-invertase [Escherichia coli]GCP05383.1 DNA-invertase [Escherichia coli]GCR29783.1 DNA-invertase [Escherichia coli]HBD3628063.1 recombinase family protein [Escherichia coli]HEC3916544.1 recombinase family protein [Escherichia coli]